MKNNFNQNLDKKYDSRLLRVREKGQKAAIKIELLSDDININQQVSVHQEIYDVIAQTTKWTEQLNIQFLLLKTALLRKLDEALQYGKQWQASIIEMQIQIEKDKIEIQRQQQIAKQDYKEKILHINTSFLQKIIKAFENLWKEIEENKIDVVFKDFNIYLQQIQKNDTSKEEYKLINQFDQKEICYSIAFDRQRNIMVSGAQDGIKIWRFQDGKKIECIQQIKGDSEIDYATCLVFSQKADFFISGSFDSSIKLYYNQNDKWLKQTCKTSHSGLVTCVILTNQEDQLISCSQDLSIFIWKVNLTYKSIQFDQQLKRHEKVVLSLCINQSDTEFVSTGQDQKIIIWKKDANKKWIFDQLIYHSHSDFGCRVSYITDDVIVWQQSNQRYIHFYQLKNGMYVKKQSIQFPQSESQTENFQFLFPTIYHRKKQVLIQKVNKKIYFIRFDDGTQQYKVDSSTISCSSSAVFGNLTQDGKYLVIWDSFLKQFSVYELFYE
ncbi:unnamed protein product (macronuclear) [Paramecium tetraurelia]|uniref:Uncharacterized protein n=1 Tax=Paramecium tetraurelia TaxID=5888 RepID=A0C683_PARTE|nr:uncharacterized protein GSPATT00035429001 [Paramecium tetraurelia]CAK66300.1 unnamed protein product [Paramecium tetraurelia]|eukprot:XP_001433697.1 hypothetical protein (macronuclear) [Paramecium tetraurelia strain d4-2]